MTLPVSRLRAVLLAAVLVLGGILSTHGVAMAASVSILQNISANNGASAALNPSLTLKNNVTAGSYILVFLAQETNVEPDPPTDSLGNTYRFLGGEAGQNGANLGGGWYGAVSSGGGHDKIQFATAAASAFGAYEVGNYTPGHNGTVEEEQMTQQDPASFFVTGGDISSVGDMAFGLIISPQSVTWTLDPATPGWAQDFGTATAGVSAQAYHIQPASTGNFPLYLNSSVPVTAIVTCVVIAHN